VIVISSKLLPAYVTLLAILLPRCKNFSWLQISAHGFNRGCNVMVSFVENGFIHFKEK